MTRTPILACLVLLFMPTAPAQAAGDALDIARFRQLRSEGVAAANAGDLDLSSRKLAEAGALIPHHPGLLLMQARVAAASGQPVEAIGFLRRYADMGLFLDVSREPALQDLLSRPDYADVERRMVANRRPVGEPSSLNRDLSLHLLEGLAWSRSESRLLVSSIRERTIYQLVEGQGLSPWLAESQPLGIYGLAVDDRRDRVWAAASGSAEAGAAEDARGKAELLEIELSSGRVLARHAPPSAQRRNLGDVAVAPDGTVAVSDSANGDLLLLRPGAVAFERLVAPGVVGSPQGMVFSDDGALLLLADYGSGLYRIEIGTGRIDPVAPPDGMTFIAVDGLSRAPDGSIWAVQNGVSPNRLLSLTLTPDWRSVDGAVVRAANLPEMDQPSGLAMRDDGVVLIQQSQWGAFGPDGAPRVGPGQAAIIVRFPFPPAP